MTHKGDFVNISAWQQPRKVIPLQAQANTCTMPRKASLASKTCPKRKSSNAFGITKNNHVLKADTVSTGNVKPIECCMIWGIGYRIVRTTFTIRIRFTIARSAINT
jgi:hypothetical protein